MNTENRPTLNNLMSEKEIVHTLNEIVKLPDEKPVPSLRMKHISHLDLDGYGASFLSKAIQRVFPEGAMTLELSNILPNKLNPEVKETIAHIDDYDLIIITDLAVNQELVDMINECPQKEKIRVFDHHICDIKDLPSNFTIANDSPIHEGKLTCATELYYNFIRHDGIYSLFIDPNMRRAIGYFVECVRAYDTFEFWKTRNDEPNTILMSHRDASRLNSLFHIMNREEFEAMIFDYFENPSWEQLTQSSPNYPWVSKILELEEEKNTKYIESAIRRLIRTPFKCTVQRNGVIHELDYYIGIIFAEKSSPIIANTALERNPDLQFCAVVSNNQISIYTDKDDVDAAKIAKLFGGGGHKEAAGFTIPYSNAGTFNLQHFARIVECAGLLPIETIKFDKTKVIINNPDK